MKGAGRIAVLALLVCCIGSGCGSKKEGEPDLLSSFSMNRDENLVVIANRDEIEDKDEFARLLVCAKRTHSSPSSSPQIVGMQQVWICVCIFGEMRLKVMIRS